MLGSVGLATALGCCDSSPLTVAPVPPAKDYASEMARLAKLTDQELEAGIGQQVKSFCGNCHAIPDGTEAPREEWRREVAQAYEFHRDSPHNNKPAPDIEAVIAYYERKAIPYSEFTVPPLGESDCGAIRFKTTAIQLDPVWTLPTISGMTWVPPQNGRPGFLLVCEMQTGGFYKVDLGGGKIPPSSVPLIKPGSTHLSFPCYSQICDLDSNGLTDFVVADLGTLNSSDVTDGRVVWLRCTSSSNYEPVEIASSLGRVADVQVGDFDGDMDQDLVVGEFGYLQTGGIRLLKNLGLSEGQLKFEMTTLDPRHGTIHVPVADLNRDGKLDFVALISQEHEVIVAYLGNGDGTFEQKRVFAAPSPSWGSSGIQLIDMDSDGDVDVLYANGDSIGRGKLKPYEAVHWLENRGSFPWVHQELIKMPGCHRAMAGDMDGDGDLDVVAVSFLSPSILDRFGNDKFAAVCWLEQTAPGKFVRRTLELGDCNHASLEIGDFDADGDIDLAVGNFFNRMPSENVQPPSLTIWWNETPRQSRDAPSCRGGTVSR